MRRTSCAGRALSIVAGALWALPVAAQDGAERYVDAAVAMQCAARVQPDGPAAREAANDKILRAHGWTRTSFAEAGFVHASDAQVRDAIRRGSAQCAAVQGQAGRFTGKFKEGAIEGKADVHFRAKGVRGTVTAVYRGRSIRIAIRDQNLKAGRIQVSGAVRHASYALIMNYEGNELDALLVVDGGAGPERVKFRIPRK